MPSATKSKKAPQATPSKSCHPATPPYSPTQTPSSKVTTSEDAQLNNPKQATEEVSGAGPTFTTDPSIGKDEGKSRIRASKIEYKTLNEVYVLLSLR